MRNDTLLTPGNLRRRFGNVARDFVGDDQHTVFVRVKEVARVDGCAADFHGRTKINQMNAGVGNAKAAGKIMETERADFIDIAHVAVGDYADATEAPMNVGLHFAKVSADTGRLIEILHDDNARFGNFQYPLPEIMARRGLRSGLVRRKTGGDGVADHYAKVREQAADVRRQETLVARADVKPFDGVRNRRRAQVPQGVELVPGKFHQGFPPADRATRTKAGFPFWRNRASRPHAPDYTTRGHGNRQT